jgi:UDP-glucose 4-epimerase
MGRRVLVTGLGTFWGGRVAQALEADPGVELVVGIDTREPTVALERTEFVRTGPAYPAMARLVRATQVDTIVHASLVVDAAHLSSRRAHEANVIGTMNLFAAAGQPDSRVTSLVVKSSTLVYGAHHRDPTWFGEDTPRTSPPRHRTERSLVEVESYVRDHAADNPHVTLALLRFANVVGPDLDTPLTRALRGPVAPSIAGFDPRLQVVHQDDVVRAITFVLDRGLGGIHHVAGDGLLPWSEVVALCGRRRVPLPLAGRGLLAGALRHAGLGGMDLPPELAALLTYGRGVDNSRLQAAGFAYRHTSAGAIRAFAEADRLRRAVGRGDTPGDGGTGGTYRYEADLERFLRHSPAVVR